MRRLIALAALALIAAAPAQPAIKGTKSAAGKPAASKPPLARPAPPAAAPKAAAAPLAVVGPLDSQDPQSLIDLLARAGADAQRGRRDEDSVLLVVKSPAANFSVQFAGCDRQGRKCQGALFDALTAGSPSLTQVNGFNQTSLNCRIYLDRGGQAHVLYSALLLKSDTRETFEVHLAAWQGCIVEARDFARDPAGYLANAA
jgi:hypothetical protein